MGGDITFFGTHSPSPFSSLFINMRFCFALLSKSEKENSKLCLKLKQVKEQVVFFGKKLGKYWQFLEVSYQLYGGKMAAFWVLSCDFRQKGKA